MVGSGGWGPLVDGCGDAVDGGGDEDESGTAALGGTTDGDAIEGEGAVAGAAAVAVDAGATCCCEVVTAAAAAAAGGTVTPKMAASMADVSGALDGPAGVSTPLGAPTPTAGAGSGGRGCWLVCATTVAMIVERNGGVQ